MKLRSRAPAAAIFPPPPRSPTGHQRDRRPSSLPGAGRAEALTGREAGGGGGGGGRLRGSHRAGWRPGRKTERKGTESRLCLRNLRAAVPGASVGGGALFPAASGRGAGPGLFPFLKAGAGGGAELPEGGVRGGPPRAGALFGIPSSRSPIPASGCPYPILFFFTLPGHMASGRGAVCWNFLLKTVFCILKLNGFNKTVK